MNKVRPEENLAAARDLFDEALAEKDLHKQAVNAVDIANMVMGTDHEDSIGAMSAKGAKGFLEKIAHRLEEIQPKVEHSPEGEIVSHALYDIHERLREVTQADEYNSDHKKAHANTRGGFKAYRAG